MEYLPTTQQQPPSELHIDGSQLKKVDTFKYLGSHISANGHIDDEINFRVQQANRAYGRLSNRVFHNRNITLTTKVMVYNAVVLSSLLYGSETWTLYCHHLRSLENFHNASLRKILGVTWKDKVPVTEVLRRTKSVSVENIIYRSHLRWIGHLIRMDDSRLPKQLLYGELSVGTRSVGRQLKRYRDQSLAVLKACHISSTNLEALAKDRDAWRETCRKGLQIRERDRLKWLEERRRKRKSKLSKTAVGSPSLFCTVCGRGCLSPIGLISHSRVHKKKKDKKDLQQLVVVIIGPDGLP
jgi:transcription termination factor 2